MQPKNRPQNRAGLIIADNIASGSAVCLQGVLAVLLVVILSACSMSPSMKAVADKPIDLSGKWLLDRHESDDVRERLAPQIDKRERRFRKVDSAMEQGPMLQRPPENIAPPDMPPELSTMQWFRQQRQREAQELFTFLTPATQLEIHQETNQSKREVRLHSDKGGGTRVLVPGEVSSLFVTMGGFVVTSGWNAASFLVNSRGTGENGIQMVERYTVLDAGTRLEETVEIHVPSLGKQVFRFMYKRAPDSRS